MYSGSYRTGFTELITVCVTIQLYHVDCAHSGPVGPESLDALLRINFLVQVHAKYTCQFFGTGLRKTGGSDFGHPLYQGSASVQFFFQAGRFELYRQHWPVFASFPQGCKFRFCVVIK